MAECASLRLRDLPNLDAAGKKAMLLNVQAMQGVLRKDGLPYATHPARLAMVLDHTLSRSKARDAHVFALLHDYLEELDARDAAGFEALGAAFPERPDAAFAAIVLTQPDLDYATINRRFGLPAGAKVAKTVAYVVQLRDFLAGGGERAYADSCLADKIANLTDLGFITDDPTKPAEQQRAALAYMVGKYSYVIDAIGPFASKPLRELAQRCCESVADEARALGATDEDFERKTAQYQRVDGDAAPTLRSQIERYHGSVGTLDWYHPAAGRPDERESP